MAWHQQLPRTGEGKGVNCLRNSLPSGALRTDAGGVVRTAGAAHSSPALLAASLPTVLLSGSIANLISHKHRAESAALSTCVPQILWLGNLENLTIISTNIFFTIRSVSFREKLAWPDKIKICLTTWKCSKDKKKNSRLKYSLARYTSNNSSVSESSGCEIKPQGGVARKQLWTPPSTSKERKQNGPINPNNKNLNLVNDCGKRQYHKI